MSGSSKSASEVGRVNETLKLTAFSYSCGYLGNFVEVIVGFFSVRIHIIDQEGEILNSLQHQVFKMALDPNVTEGLTANVIKLLFFVAEVPLE